MVLPSPFHIRALTPADAAAYQSLRLTALREEPTAFGSSYEEECDIPLSVIGQRLAPVSDRGRLGAFVDGTLAGMVTLGREDGRKHAHKARVWGMYVSAHCRGKGVGLGLLTEALALARRMPEIRQVQLDVTASNASAVALYQAAGFQEYGREPGAMLVDGELLDAIHMVLRFGVSSTI